MEIASSSTGSSSSTSSLRVVVSEDDPVQLDAIVSMVRQLKPQWQIVATARDVPTLLRSLDDLAPDLLILDIHLPGGEGNVWMNGVTSAVPTLFVTGDPTFAVQAFETAAIDYVLKPITPRRLKLALDRASSDARLAPRGSAPAPDPAGPLAWIGMKRGHDVVMVGVSDICFLQAEQKYTRVVTQSGEGLIRTGISELQRRLDEKVFVKIHRSIVVNLNYVSTIRRDILGHLEVRLHGRNEVLKVSKNFQHVFRAL